jgi:sulfatase maturation enzyme AslB (radical SAM superfamily)
MLTATSENGRATELQVQIDDVYACLGLCAGCVLSPEERKGKTPDMSADILEMAISRLVDHAQAMRPLNRVNVTFAIADHILMGADYMKHIHALGSKIVRAGQPASMDFSGVFFTTSLVGKPTRVMDMLKEVRDSIEDDVPFIPLVVLDGRVVNATKFGAQWREMVLYAKELFGKVDLNTNLSVEACALMSPSELLSFAADNGFDDVTVNWTPTIANASATLSDNEAIADWLIAFDDLVRARGDITTGYGQYLDRVVENAIRDRGSDAASGMADYVKALVPETIRKSVEIDHHGNVLAKFEAVGDIPHAPRHGLRPLGHVSEGSIDDILAKGQSTMLRSVMTQHARGACLTCDYNAVCAVTGFHVSTNVARMSGRKEAAGQCPHVARPLIAAAYRRVLAASVEQAGA